MSIFRPHPSPDLVVGSLGLGVQSTAMALMAEHEEFERQPDLWIFSDTGWEPKHVYENLEWLTSGNVLSVPVIVTGNKRSDSSGSIRQDLVDRIENQKTRFASIPFFCLGDDKKVGMGQRQCTREYKIDAIAVAIRAHLGVERLTGYAVEVWKGITVDEIRRAAMGKGPKWEYCRYPLIEKGMSRWACESWLRRHDYPLPRKSSCIGCPYHHNAEWRDMRDNRPDEWADAIEIDELIRNGGRWGRDRPQFMHRSCVPLADADLEDDDPNQLGMFGDCEGMCGV